MKSSARLTWESPRIVPLRSWVESLWEGSWPGLPLLSKVRAQVLWDRIVSGDRKLSGRDPHVAYGVAKRAYEAYSLSKEYCIEFPEDDFYLTEEARTFKRWMSVYDAGVEELGFMEPLSLPREVARLIDEGRIAPPPGVVMAGFDEITPLTASLIAAMERRATKVTYWNTAPADAGTIPAGINTPTIRSFPDEAEEVIQAARWVRRTITAGGRVGIIVPELERYRRLIRHEFKAELTPGSVLPWEAQRVPFNISLGSTLYEEPLLRAAFTILSVDEGANEIDDISSILSSPFIHTGETEWHGMARIDAMLRDRNVLTISLHELLGCVKRSISNGLDNLDRFKGRLEGWIKMLREARGRRPPGEWAEHFTGLLMEVGWPSPPTALDSDEYQLVMKWNELIADLAGLDDIVGTISRQEAVSILKRMARDRVHQPESPDLPVQVMGILEASGILFDNIWIMGAHEDAFPSQPSPNPFIPIDIQKAKNIPRSSYEREFGFAKAVLRRLIHASPSIEVSYPESINEKELRLSPLFAQLDGRKDSTMITESHRLVDAVHASASMEDMDPEDRIPITPEERRHISGGASIVKDQSACPFKAFSIHRLNAGGITIPTPGLTYAQRGAIIHKAMKIFWDKVKDSGQLKAAEARGELTSLIREAAGEAFTGVRLMQRLSRRYLAMERERLEGLLGEWLAIESKRSDFTVKATEHLTAIVVGGLEIAARFDRIDTITGGRQVILDYKTGDCSRNDWLGGRPKEPQLLLYNLSGRYDAVAFASLKRGRCEFIGIAREGDILPGLKPLDKDRWKEGVDGVQNWDDLMERWRRVIKTLVEDFVGGRTAVDPARYGAADSACTYCELTGLCRIFEREGYAGIRAGSPNRL